MAEYVYEPSVALDPSQGSGTLVRSASGQIFAIADEAFATPLVVRTSSGPTTTIKASTQGVTESFTVDDQPQVRWKSGPYVVPLMSATGILLAIQDAAGSAAASAQAARESADSAMRIGRPGLRTPTFWGTFDASNQPTAEEGAVLGDWGFRTGS